MTALISAEEMTHRAASNAELTAWIDEQDHPLGSPPRVELRKRGLIGRDTFILLFNPVGELRMQRRTLSKAIYPGYWDLTTGSMVQAGEPYVDSVTRELEEELGTRDAILREYSRFLFDEPGNRLWYAVFSVVSNAPLRLWAEETSEARFVRPELALEEARSLPYCLSSLQALRLYLDA